MRGRTKGYLGFTAAPDRHKVIFENALVRVLEVTFPANGQAEPMHAGHWAIRWMKPESMHAIESVENNRKPGEPPFLRVEIKVGK